MSSDKVDDILNSVRRAIRGDADLVRLFEANVSTFRAAINQAVQGALLALLRETRETISRVHKNYPASADRVALAQRAVVDKIRKGAFHPHPRRDDDEALIDAVQEPAWNWIMSFLEPDLIEKLLNTGLLQAWVAELQGTAAVSNGGELYFTTAPRDYDGFETQHVEAFDLAGLQWRVVRIVSRDLSWQLARYGSGGYAYTQEDPRVVAREAAERAAQWKVAEEKRAAVRAQMEAAAGRGDLAELRKLRDAWREVRGDIGDDLVLHDRLVRNVETDLTRQAAYEKHLAEFEAFKAKFGEPDDVVAMREPRGDAPPRLRLLGRPLRWAPPTPGYYEHGGTVHTITGGYDLNERIRWQNARGRTEHGWQSRLTAVSSPAPDAVIKAQRVLYADDVDAVTYEGKRYYVVHFDIYQENGRKLPSNHKSQQAIRRARWER